MQEFMMNQVLVNEVVLGGLFCVLSCLLFLVFRSGEVVRINEIFEQFKHDEAERGQSLKQDIQGYLRELEDDESLRLRELKQDVNNMLNTHRDTVSSSISLMGEGQGQHFSQLREMLEGRIQNFDKSQSKGMENLNVTVAQQMKLFSDGQVNGMKQMTDTLDKTITMFKDGQTGKIEQLSKGLNNQLESMVKNIAFLQKDNQDNMEKLRNEVARGLEKMRLENEKKLEEIRGTVNEQLQTTLEKRITESFKTVNDQLQQVYRGLGEMKNLATDVGGLKKVLSNVKTRGILGEVQLKSILQEILTQEQYDENVVTVPGSSERVEFAVKMPGDDDKGFVYLPIDAKFPNDTYQKLLDARENGDKAEIEQAYKSLEAVVKSEAKDIRNKYISIPHTTNFGIMFLASEGLYAEVVNRGLMQVLQHDYQIAVTGPSTMAAFLNSLRMGFNTLAIQKRSNEVWQVLGGVKTEFEKFEDGLRKMQDKINGANKELEELVGRRTRAINRKLRDVVELDIHQADKVLQLNSQDE